MGIQQLQRSHARFADQSGNTRQREFQFFRFGRRWQKQAALRRSWPRRFRRKMNLQDGRARRMRIQIQLQQLEEKFGIQHGKRKSESAMKLNGENFDFRFSIADCSEDC